MLYALLRYLESKDNLAVARRHAMVMVAKDLENMSGEYFPNKARLKQIFHLVHEVLYLEVQYLEQTLSYRKEDFLADRGLKEGSPEADRATAYFARQKERYYAIPVLLREEAGKDLYERLGAWYHRGGVVDTHSRTVQELNHVSEKETSQASPTLSAGTEKKLLPGVV